MKIAYQRALFFSECRKYDGWKTTTDTTSESGAKFLFRLYDMLKVSVRQGRLCADCQDCVEQFDRAKAKAAAALDEWKFRQDHDDDDLYDEEQSEKAGLFFGPLFF